MPSIIHAHWPPCLIMVSYMYLWSVVSGQLVDQWHSAVVTCRTLSRYLHANSGRREFYLVGYMTPGCLKSPSGLRGQSPARESLGDEVLQKLKQFADIVCRLWLQKQSKFGCKSDDILPTLQYMKINRAISLYGRRRGVHFPSLGYQPVGGYITKSVTHLLCDARPTFTFPTAERNRPLVGAKLYCLTTEAQGYPLRNIA